MVTNAESSEKTGPSNFALFGQLPTELRLQIWKEALLTTQPRVVLLELKRLSTKSHQDESLGQETGLRWGFRSSCPIPALLATCRESHGVASTFYQQSFGTEHALPQTWFDFERDLLYLKAPAWRQPLDRGTEPSYKAMLHSLDQEERHKIKRLVVSDYAMLIDGDFAPAIHRFDAFVQVLGIFDSVQELYPVFLDAWTPKDIEKGTQLILRNAPDRALIIRHLFKNSSRRKEYCVCFNEIVDHWEKFHASPMQHYEHTDTNTRLAAMYPEKKPKVRETMVFTPHFYRVFSEARKPYNSRASGPGRDYIPQGEYWSPTRTI